MKCNNCGANFEGTFCSNCGAKPIKKKKPFYLRWWFILLAIIAILMGVLSYQSSGEKIVWNDMVLGEKLPESPAKRGTIHDNSTEKLWLDINKVSDKEYADYIKECKEKGFSVDLKSDSLSFEAYNEDGYKLSLSHYGNNEEMSIQLEAPMEMSTISWPDSVAGKQLPVPNSTIGQFSYENDDNFFVYIGETTKDDYTKYAKACSDKGFKVDFIKGDDYYYAYNNDGWYIDLRYVGNNVMSVNILPPDEEDDTIKETKAEEPKDESDSSNLDSDFKEAMDSYESFMNDYVEFMKKYKDNPSDPSLIADYANYISDYADFVEDFANWENEDLNADELAYYVDVQARVSKKLLEVAN